jgi:hypothetical protein
MVPKYCTVLILLFIEMFRLVRQAYLRLRMGDAEMGRAVAIIEI